VNVERIVKQLRHEATANPKKAAVLGLLGVVALWFWAPLVWGWIVPEDEEAEDAVVVTAAQPAQPGGEPVRSDTAANEDAPKAGHPWRQLAEWMDNDPRTLPAELVADLRDPFMTPKPQVAEAKPEEIPEELQQNVTPESLGMALTSTVVGPRYAVARINKKSYRRGKSVTLVKDGQQIEFKLTEIHRGRVVLEREGEKFELRAPSPATHGGIEVVRGTH